MKQAVWDEPPLDFDPDTFMARAEQLTKRRRALMSVGVATALIIATVATLPAFLVGGRGRTDAAGSVTATTTAAPTSVDFPWPPNSAARRNHTFEEDQPFLIQMWVNVLSPGLQRQGVDPATIGTWSPTFQHTGNERAGSISDVLLGSVAYIGSTGPAMLDVTIAGVGAWEPSPDRMCARAKPGDAKCDVIKKSDGSVVVTMEVGGNKPSNGAFYSGERTVYHYRLDGSVVAMTSRTQFIDSNSFETTRIPLTFDQLISLATDEGIRLPG
jgi:hypothetical protein